MSASIGGLAYEALLREAEATPKPGLVDAANSGAHKDMDLPLFQISAAAIAPYFYDFAQLGADEAAYPLATRLPGIRPLGIAAEGAMFAATNGVNTHKGAIFTLGILTYLCGRLEALGQPLAPEALSDAAKVMCHDVVQELRVDKARTKGEQVFSAYGAPGIRGEAAAGFPSVIHIALPCLSASEYAGLSDNHRLCHTLIHLIANVDDTNLLARGGASGAQYAKDAAREFLAAHSPFDPDYQAALSGLDRAFISRNLSPGGCADLLSAAWFLDSVQRAW